MADDYNHTAGSFMDEDFPDWNFGGNVEVVLGRAGGKGGALQKPILRFDFSAGGYASEDIEEALVYLFTDTAILTGDSQACFWDVHDDYVGWVEGTNGDGQPGVTWNDYNAGAWGVAGGNLGTVQCPWLEVVNGHNWFDVTDIVKHCIDDHSSIFNGIMALRYPEAEEYMIAEFDASAPISIVLRITEAAPPAGDILKISGVDWANVKQVSGVAEASISVVSGVTAN